MLVTSSPLAGYVNVWSLEQATPASQQISEDGKDAKNEWCWRASTKWLSSALFLPVDDSRRRLMTTANDGVLRMWDLDKIVSSGGPKEVRLMRRPFTGCRSLRHSSARNVSNPTQCL